VSKEHLNAKAPAAETLSSTAPRIDKTLHWLEKSRGSWKQKTQESKTKLKITTLALKRAKEGRDKRTEKLENFFCDTQKQLHQKDVEITLLQKQLERAHQEIEDLKKKKSHPTQANRGSTPIGTA
jgi:hypothetical protein